MSEAPTPDAPAEPAGEPKPDESLREESVPDEQAPEEPVRSEQAPEPTPDEQLDEPPAPETAETPETASSPAWPAAEEPGWPQEPVPEEPRHPEPDSSGDTTIQQPRPQQPSPQQPSPQQASPQQASPQQARPQQPSPQWPAPTRHDPGADATIRVPRPLTPPPPPRQRPPQGPPPRGPQGAPPRQGPPAPPQSPPPLQRPPQQRPAQRGAAFWDQHPPRPSAPWPPPEPPRAAPVRVGPPPDPKPEPRPEPEPERPAPRNRTRLLIAVAVVAVVALAAGVVFAVPGLSDRLGITDPTPEAAGPPAPPVEFSPGLRAPGGDAPAPTPDGVQAALAGPAAAPELGTLTGVVLDPATGETLWESAPNTPLVPASTTKLLTGAAALLSLDPTQQLVTRVVQGEEPGSVVIVGGGDPTLSSLEEGVESVYTGPPHLSDLVEQVKASGVQVDTVYVDLSRYAGEGMAPGWLDIDVAAGYITPMVPAMLDGGRADDPQAQNGTRTDNPARALAEEFADRIGATVPSAAEQTAPEGAKVLGEVRSAPMVELVDNMLRTSDNVLGEAVAREVAKAAGKEVSFAGGSEATREVLAENGFDLTGVELADGSGLSTENRVPAALLGEILNVAAAPSGDDPRTAKLRPLLGGLPVAGGSGTLDDRYDTAASTAGKGYVRAKTGTLSGVNSLAGIVLNADGRVLVFALMTAGTTSSARPALDAIAATLRDCGCR
ncbi:D-alanyl-D-alanine carboxypeptidase/D-alanyl-D-alanine-endopeptidase [Actinophytocola sp. S1-96]|uniref:D-alanyl-D-alanine carboxypeptidase/D-alanyl-D-alanine-endopeptidase n=1 Tax=Actinophytocola gossypii TaxID=2812003 RepID=A0ABT2J4L1_9PSEU|nr:D-alanyl-D-alanine carboxypeptidase/D-alanyl-D-alanine-endopeptidase [Actinophytocola gossypii]